MEITLHARRPFLARLRDFCLGAAMVLGAAVGVQAQDAGGPPAQYAGATTMRSGGVIGDSYYYHHLGPMRSAVEAGCIPQANGWYEYGFPMQSYRYGWFGAERQYPRLIWHDGYYGDCIRTAYR